MNKKIFRSILLVSTVVLFLGIMLVMAVLYQYFGDKTIGELRSEANYIKTAVEINGTDYLKQISDKSKRITYVSTDGSVIFDNKSDPKKMDNHSSREEIREAYKDGVGVSSRKSDTLVEKTIYYAVKLDNGNVIRISATENSVLLMVVGMLQPAALIVFFMILLSAVISSALSKKILKPINDIDIENPDSNVTYEELSPLLLKIAKQNKTIRRQIDEASQKQKEFEVITENMNEGILVIDRATNLLSCNSAAERLLGANISKRNKSVLAINRSDSFREVVEKSVNGVNCEKTLEIDDKVYQLIANPVLFNSSTAGAVILIIDITEKAKNEKLRKEFSANVSHELKTPLTSISGFAELIKNGVVNSDDIIDFSKSIYDESQRLIALVNDIIKISVLDENVIPFDDELVDIFDVAKNNIDRLESSAKKNSIKLTLLGESAKINGNGQILNEMIFNLCDNAIKYNKPGGNVDVIINQNSDNIKLCVRDNGIGIPAEFQDRVFERFFRVDKSHSKEIGGTGLGLSIVKHAAAFHNAEIKLESKEDSGTAITIIFKK